MDDWHPFVHSSFVEIDADALSKVLHGLKRIQEHMTDQLQLITLVFVKSGIIVKKGIEGSEAIGPHVIFGLHRRDNVPPELIFDLWGFEVAYALNPEFRKMPRKVVLSANDEHIVATFESR